MVEHENEVRYRKFHLTHKILTRFLGSGNCTHGGGFIRSHVVSKVRKSSVDNEGFTLIFVKSIWRFFRGNIRSQ